MGGSEGPPSPAGREFVAHWRITIQAVAFRRPATLPIDARSDTLLTDVAGPDRPLEAAIQEEAGDDNPARVTASDGAGRIDHYLRHGPHRETRAERRCESDRPAEPRRQRPHPQRGCSSPDPSTKLDGSSVKNPGQFSWPTWACHGHERSRARLSAMLPIGSTTSPTRPNRCSTALRPMDASAVSFTC